MFAPLLPAASQTPPNPSASKIQSPKSKTSASPPPAAPNLVRNADFTNGTEGWLPELGTGTAHGSLRLLTAAELPPGVSGKGVHFDIASVDDQKWHLQFNQMGLSLTPRLAYTLSFWARSDRERPLEANFSVDNGDFHLIGLSAPIQLTARWQQYAFAFSPAEVPPGHARLDFVLGGALAPVEIASVRLTRGVAPRPLGSNVLQNANFENGVEKWTLTADPANVKTALLAPASESAALPAGLPATALRISSEKASGQSWQAQIFQTFPNLREGEPYTLTFWAKADHDRSLTVGTSANGGDYRTIGYDGRVNLTTTWRKYALLFTGGHVEKDEVSRLAFSFGDVAGTLDLSGIALQPGVAPQFLPAPALPVSTPTARADAPNSTRTRPNLKAHPLIGLWESFHRDVTLTGQTYERYRIYFGADGRGNLKITIAGAQDDKPTRPDIADKFTWEPAGSGPHVAIGKHVYTWTITPDGPRKKLTLKNYEGKTYILFREAGK